jgi:hypothetical protein
MTFSFSVLGFDESSKVDVLLLSSDIESGTATSSLKDIKVVHESGSCAIAPGLSIPIAERRKVSANIDHVI